MKFKYAKLFFKELKTAFKDNNKYIYFILIILLLIFLVIPTHDSIEHEIFQINIPHKLYENNMGLDYKIEIKEKCYNEKFNGISDISDLVFKRKPSNNIDRVISFSYENYDIVIYGIEKCDCINDNEVSLNQPQSCLLNNSRVFGYFKNGEYQNSQIIPFVLDRQFQLLSPDKKFKLHFEIEETKEGIENHQYQNMMINTEYRINTIITYPKKKAHPIVLMLADLVRYTNPINFITAVYDAKNEKWEYK